LNHINKFNFKDKYERAILLLVKQIDNMNLNHFLSLPNSVLESIFTSDQLQIENEDFLLNLILQMNDNDPNRKCLFK
jgi:hypothetical protein